MNSGAAKDDEDLDEYEEDDQIHRELGGKEVKYSLHEY